MTTPVLHLNFANSLRGMLCTCKDTGIITYPLTRRASIKDIIESLGVPHTEIGKISLAGNELGFDYIPENTTSIEIEPISDKTPVTSPTRLRPVSFDEHKFLIDDNVLKLGRNLRMIGFDSVNVINGEPGLIIEQAAKERRIVLSRNRDLLKMKAIYHGQLLRSENHIEQTAEVVRRYDLYSQIRPFSRCLSCNGTLRVVDKNAILHLLEPLTKKYYSTFKQCEDCKKVYWKGSHHEKMMRLISSISP